MSIFHKIMDKLQRNWKIYTDAVNKGKVMGLGYTLLLWKNHTKFLLRMRTLKDRFVEVDKVVCFMEKEFGCFVEQFKHLPTYYYDISKDESWKQNKIWIYWNNPDSMPLMVKSCVNRIKEMNNGHEVVILTDRNVGKYIDFDPVVWQKYKEGKITRTHFSDFIRVAVLYRYGGVYFDSTIYPTRPLDDKFFNLPFFSNHTERTPNDPQIAHSRWSSFMCGCRRGNLLMKAALETFTEYWKRYNGLMDYVLIDYTYNLLYNHVPSIKQMIDNTPFNNPHIWDQQACLDKPCTEERFAELMAEPLADVYKFSYKDSIGLPLHDENGTPTLLGRICGEK